MLRKVSLTSFPLCSFSAILLILAFPQTDIWPLAWVAFVPLFFALEGKSFKSTLFLSYFTGVLFFTGTLYWFIHVTVLGAALLVLYLAVYFMVFGLLVYHFKNKSFFEKLFLLPCAWVALEYMRAHLLTGFGWASLGHSQYKNLPIIQMADITGLYGVSFIIMMANVLIKEIVSERQKKISFCCAFFIFPTIISIVLMIVAFGYGFCRLNGRTHASSEKIKIALIQANIPQEIKWDQNRWPLIMKKYLDLTKNAAQEKPDLIIWPETAFPGFLWEAPELFENLKNFVAAIKIPLLLGIVTQREEAYFNTAILIGPEGRVIREYDKLHLVPFGEYIPFRRTFPFLTNIVPIGDFTAGKRYTLFPDVSSPSANHNSKNTFAVLICFEDTVAPLSREFIRRGANLLVNITNDAWFQDTKAPFMHLQASVFQAVANRRNLVRSANTGVSCFIDSHGRVFKYVENRDGRKTYVAGTVMTEATFNSEETFYTKYGDVFTYLCFGSILWAVRRKKMI